jgi:hypothetical protein
MKILDQLIGKAPDTEKLSFEWKRAIKSQYRTLKKLLSKGEFTDYGKRYNFGDILDQEDMYEAFSKKLPITNYGSLFPWWQRAYRGEEDVCWPGKVDYFALSSGTSEGSSKYIPVSQDMLKAIKKVSIKQILSIAKTDMPKDYLTKHYLMIAGSADLNYNGVNYSGDLSGITTQSLPFWFERFSRPDKYIRKEKNWENKIEQIVNHAREYDVAMIAGVPAWIQILFEKIIEKYDLDNIHEIWPNLSVYIHGGVSISPYKKTLDRLMGKPIMYFNTYLASEGFIAFQNKLDSEGMHLVFNNGIFYEFVPFNKDNFTESGEIKPNAEVIKLEDVVENEEYALLITTCSGAWRYMIGDTIKVISKDKCEIVITGRTKHFLSLCGEHLSVDNMNKALELTANHFDIELNEFTVKGIPFEGKFAHVWYIACEDHGISEEQIKEILDVNLKALNDDYKTERAHALKNVVVNLIPLKLFIDWMESIGKLGSQNKFPRVLTDAQFEDWKKFLEKNLKANSD